MVLITWSMLATTALYLLCKCLFYKMLMKV
uniref:Uncharacterized protein n=1 Tax=Arundo donax TaxID=35708 RepID=A0A0A8YVF1_ARUDO